jgi:hypothetical protein
MPKPHKLSRTWTDVRRILSLFSRPKRTYTRAAVLTLIRTESDELDRLCAVHDIRPDGDLFAWEDVAFLAVEERWPVRRIASVLQRHRRGVPPYNRPVTLQVQLPLYQVHTLKQEAKRLTEERRTPWTISDTLTLALSSWIASQSDLPSAVAQADHWPLPPPEEPDGAKPGEKRPQRPARRGR